MEFFLAQTTDYDLYVEMSEEDGYTDYVPTDEAAIRRHARNATRCWIYSCTRDWEPVRGKPGTWQSCAVKVPRIDDDEIHINLNLERPDSEGECIYILARHRDKSRCPWL